MLACKPVSSRAAVHTRITHMPTHMCTNNTHMYAYNTRCVQVIKDLAIPVRQGNVTYKETFVCFVKRVLDHELYGEDDDDDEEDAELEDQQKSAKGKGSERRKVLEGPAAIACLYACRNERKHCVRMCPVSALLYIATSLL
jgi:hypothetical protein